ncbi:YhjD/YihY/BrkB family envelope integrity protein [Actinophytocola oryzae]|uniref:Membrane protein n=1 Tax=Actinophytocola oryzae TaxID=502181 RepID=A0A4R7W0Q8_9PSEU|nr:YhjD/YihY/BrkB family envelope integrity protein [Actinophytocola oryzae]TDV56106.1 membrane protein [Actinophytocola oryzae]
MPRARAALHAVVGHVRDALRGRDLVLWAAGLTFYGMVAMVPVLLLALRGAATLFGDGLVLDGARHLGRSLPHAHDAGPPLSTLAAGAVSATWPSLLAMLLPASLYGEGLRRGLIAVTGRPVPGSTGWAGRLRFLPVLVAAPLLVAFPLAFAPVVAPLYEAGGWARVLGIVLSFHLDLVPMWVVVAFVFARTGPSVLPTRAAVLAGFVLGAVLTGFLHGFVLFLAIPVDWSIAFGGLPVVGDIVALGLWLFGLHVVLLAGYRIAVSAHTVHSRRGTPHGSVRPASGAVAG